MEGGKRCSTVRQVGRAPSPILSRIADQFAGAGQAHSIGPITIEPSGGCWVAGVAELRGAGGEPCGNHKTGREVSRRRRGHARALPSVNLTRRPAMHRMQPPSTTDPNGTRMKDKRTRSKHNTGYYCRQCHDRTCCTTAAPAHCSSLYITVHPSWTLPPLSPVHHVAVFLAGYPNRPGCR